MENGASESTTTTTPKVEVQHVTKKSSDELLRKFAELGGDDDEEKKKAKRRRSSVRKRRGEGDSSCESPSRTSLVERRSLLPTVNRKSVLLVKFGRSQVRRARDLNKKSFLAGIQKTWRKTVEGASRVLLEKHYNRHRRLISDVV